MNNRIKACTPTSYVTRVLKHFNACRTYIKRLLCCVLRLSLHQDTVALEELNVDLGHTGERESFQGFSMVDLLQTGGLSWTSPTSPL